MPILNIYIFLNIRDQTQVMSTLIYLECDDISILFRLFEYWYSPGQLLTYLCTSFDDVTSRPGTVRNVIYECKHCD